MANKLPIQTLSTKSRELAAHLKEKHSGLTMHGVQAGDIFIHNTGRTLREAFILDLREVKSKLNKQIVNVVCIARCEMLGQHTDFEVPFATVVRNKQAK